MVLQTIVKNNLRIFKNIMLYEGWEDDLESATIDVGFERIYSEGINMIYDSAVKDRKVFTKALQNYP